MGETRGMKKEKNGILEGVKESRNREEEKRSKMRKYVGRKERREEGK